jgi:hypothetical protein
MSCISRLDDICLNQIVLGLFFRNGNSRGAALLGLPPMMGHLVSIRLRSLLKWMDLHSHLFAGNKEIINSLASLVRFNGTAVDTVATADLWLASGQLLARNKFSLTAMHGMEAAARSIWDDELDEEARRLLRHVDSADMGSVADLTACWAHHLLNVHPIEVGVRAARAARICAHLGLQQAFQLWLRLLPDDDRSIVLPSLLFLCLEHDRFSLVEHLYVNYAVDLASCFAQRFPDGIADPKAVAKLTSAELSAPIGLHILEQLFVWLPSLERQKLLWSRDSYLLRRAVARNQLDIVEMLLSVAGDLGMAGTVVAAKQYEALRVARMKGFDDIYCRLLEPLPLSLRADIPDFLD